MKIRDLAPVNDETKDETSLNARERFWKERCEEEPLHPGCKLYEI